MSAWPEIRQVYLDLVRTIIPGPLSISYFVPLFLLPTALLIPPHVLSHRQLASCFFPAIVAANIHAWLCIGGVDVISTDTLWWSLYYLVLKDPRKDFTRLRYDQDPRHLHKDGTQHIRDREDYSKLDHSAVSNQRVETSGKPPSWNIIEESYPQSLAARLKWVLILLISRPPYGWKIGDPAHDSKASIPPIRQSRTQFATKLLLRLIPTACFLMPLAVQISAHDPYFSSGTASALGPHPPHDQPVSTTVSLLLALVPQPLLRPLTTGLYTYSLLTLGFQTPMLIPVFTNYFLNLPTDSWSPHTWHPHFGPFTTGVLDHGVRGLWGIWWHQQMRHVVSEPGRWLADWLGVPRKGLVRYGMICTSAFVLSGITHVGLVPPEPRWSRVPANTLRWHVGGFFWLQPLGILGEVTIVEPLIHWMWGGEGKHRNLQRTVRVMWVLLWMGFALSFLRTPYCELRYWSLWPPSFFPSKVKYVLGGSWIP